MKLTRRAFFGALLGGALAESEVVDAHVHFWDPRRLDYPWLQGSALNKPFLPSDYFGAMAGHVNKVIFVQAECLPAQALMEVDWIRQLADRDGRMAAMVAFAPITDGAGLRKMLGQLHERKLVRGVRCLTQSSPDVWACSRPEFVAGVKRVGDAGLVFEAGVNVAQLQGLTKLAEQCGPISIVVDHLGNPAIHENRFDPWAVSMRHLAALPNVSCKISGAMELAGKGWTAAGVEPYVNHVLDCFGPDRVLWGSDWPVCLSAGTARQWLDVVRELARKRGAEFQRRLFGQNARRIFEF